MKRFGACGRGSLKWQVGEEVGEGGQLGGRSGGRLGKGRPGRSRLGIGEAPGVLHVGALRVGVRGGWLQGSVLRCEGVCVWLCWIWC